MTIRIVPDTEVITIRAKVLTVDELVARYAVSNQADGKSSKTIAWYTDILTQFLRYLKANGYQSTLSTFNIDVIRGYILFLQRRPKFQGHPFILPRRESLSSKTVQCHVRVLKAFSTWLCEEEYTNVNRLKNLKLPKAAIRIMEPLTSQEIKKVMNSIDRRSYSGERNRVVLVTLLDSGLRASELAGITLSNLNLKDGYIRITGKGDKERVVPIGKFVQMELLHYIEKVRPQVYGSDCNKLFLTQGGRPMTLNNVKMVFSKLAKSSGIGRLHAHLCRHTFSINYLLNGGDIFSLREILGHTTLAMVSHYLRFTSSQITAQHHKYSPMDRIQERDGQGQY
jgi:site-specific recombinase XerD